jgi:hypothetical protein
MTQLDRDRATLAYLASNQRTKDIADYARETIQADEMARRTYTWVCVTAVALFVGAYLFAFS